MFTGIITLFLGRCGDVPSPTIATYLWGARHTQCTVLCKQYEASCRYRLRCEVSQQCSIGGCHAVHDGARCVVTVAVVTRVQCEAWEGAGKAWCTTHSASDATSLAMLTPPPRDSASLLVVDSCTVNPLASPAAKALPSRENATLCTTAGPPSPTLLRDAVRDGLRASAIMPPSRRFLSTRSRRLCRALATVCVNYRVRADPMDDDTNAALLQPVAGVSMPLGQGPAEGQRVCAVGRGSGQGQLVVRTVFLNVAKTKVISRCSVACLCA
jgi:hypothetical protein